MAIKLTSESFLAGVRQSGLIDERRLNEALQALSAPGETAPDAQAISAELVRRKLITSWQAGKILQGKFKGFVLGRYRLMELLGRGEMSTVYLAEHVRMKRRCAIKVLPANKVKDTSYLGRFLREAEAVAALDHPNIVRAYDVDQEEEAGTEIHFLAMEYVEGKDIEKLLAEQERFTPAQAAEYIRQGAEGLAHAHENGLIHRDIKPGNLLIDAKGNVKLLDLGLARFFRADEEESLTIKHDEKVLGTADYLAPEQAVDSHAVDERADVYSLGCTFYFALTGHPPFTDGTLVQRLLAHQTKVPPPISRYRDDVPAGLTDILSKMLEKRKEDRYQSARAVADALAKWLVQHGDENWRRNHPALVAAVLGFEAMTATTQPTMTAAAPDDNASRRGDGKTRSKTPRSRLSGVADSSPRTAAPPSAPALPPAAPVATAAAITPSPRPPSPRPLTPTPATRRPAAPAPATTEASASSPAPALDRPFVNAASWNGDWRSAGRWLLTRQGLLLLALVVTGVILVTGVGATLYAVTTSEAAPAAATDDAPLERLPASR